MGNPLRRLVRPVKGACRRPKMKESRKSSWAILAAMSSRVLNSSPGRWVLAAEDDPSVPGEFLQRHHQNAEPSCDLLLLLRDPSSGQMTLTNDVKCCNDPAGACDTMQSAASTILRGIAVAITVGARSPSSGMGIATAGNTAMAHHWRFCPHARASIQLR